MNDQAARILKSLIERYGTSVASDPLRCEGLLRDTCPRSSREIFVLVNAVRQQVPADLLSPRHSLPPELFRGFLVKRLQDELAFSDEAAHWAVTSWAAALGLDGEITSSAGVPDNPVKSALSPARNDSPGSGSTPEERAALAGDLESASLDTRLAALRRISTSADAGHIRLVITSLENSAWRVRESAFDALVALGEPAVPCLIEALDDSHEQIVISSIIVLGAIGSPRSVDNLVALLDSGGEIAPYAAWALGEIRDERAITPLTKCMTSSNSRLRSEVETALRKFA